MRLSRRTLPPTDARHAKCSLRGGCSFKCCCIHQRPPGATTHAVPTPIALDKGGHFLHIGRAGNKIRRLWWTVGSTTSRYLFVKVDRVYVNAKETEAEFHTGVCGRAGRKFELLQYTIVSHFSRQSSTPNTIQAEQIYCVALACQRLCARRRRARIHTRSSRWPLCSTHRVPHDESDVFFGFQHGFRNMVICGQQSIVGWSSSLRLRRLGVVSISRGHHLSITNRVGATAVAEK